MLCFGSGFFLELSQKIFYLSWHFSRTPNFIGIDTVENQSLLRTKGFLLFSLEYTL
jgi:hypothetical protein